MSEDLRRILRSAEGRRELHEAELESLRARLRTEPVDPVVPLEIDQPATRQQPGRLLLVAMVVVIALGAGTFLIRAAPSPTRVAGAPPPVCSGPLQELSQDLGSWRSIDAWARVGKAEPDLAGSVGAALEALPTAPEVVRVQVALAEVAERSGDNRGEFDSERREAMTEALTVLLARIEEFDREDVCDLSTLRNVLR